MSGPYVSIVDGQAPANALATTTSAVVLAANPNRRGLVISNASTGTVWIGINNTATLNAGIMLAASVGTWSMDDYTYTNQAITAIAHAAGSIISIQEFN